MILTNDFYYFKTYLIRGVDKMSLLGGLLGGGSGGGINVGIGGSGGINVGVGGGGIDIGIGGGGTGGGTDGGGIDIGIGGGDDGGIDVGVGGGGDGDGGTDGGTDGGSGGGAGGGGHHNGTGSSGPAHANQHKTLSFHISDGHVTSVSQLVNGVLVPVSIEPNEFFTLDGNDVIDNKILHFGTEAIRYSDPNHDGNFERHSELWTVTLEGAESGKPLPVITQLLTYLPTNGNDLEVVREGDYCLGGGGADNFVFREAGHLIVGDFNESEGDKIVIDTALGITSQAQLESYITGLSYENDSLVVDFGPAVSITLVGVGPGEISWNDVNILS